MNKAILKIIALTLSIGSLGSTHAAKISIPALAGPIAAGLSTAWLLHHPDKGETHTETPAELKKNQSYSLKAAAAYGAALPVAMITSTAAHELGHATVGSIVKPGSVQSISIGFLGGMVSFNNVISKAPKVSFVSMLAAGPAAGLAFSYAGIKSSQIYEEYQKTGNLNRAIELAREKPVLATPDSMFTKGMQHGLLYMACINAQNCLALTQPLDGTLFLRKILFNDLNAALPKKVSCLWNLAILLGAHTAGCRLKEDYAQYAQKTQEEARQKEEEMKKSGWSFWPLK